MKRILWLKRLAFAAGLAVCVLGCEGFLDFITQPEVLGPLAGGAGYGLSRAIESEPTPPPPEPCELTLSATVIDQCLVLLHVPLDQAYELLVNGTLRGTVSARNQASLLLDASRGLRAGTNVITIREIDGDCSATITVEIEADRCVATGLEAAGEQGSYCEQIPAECVEARAACEILAACEASQRTCTEDDEARFCAALEACRGEQGDLAESGWCHPNDGRQPGED